MSLQDTALSSTRPSKGKRRGSVLEASTLVIGLLILAPHPFTSKPSLLTDVSVQDSHAVTGIHGKFWKKSASNDDATSVANGSIFVTDTDLTKLYGEATTQAAAGKDAGCFQIPNLPANQNLLVFYYDPSIPGDMQVEELRLRADENKELAPNDPNAITTRVMTATDLLDPMKRLVNQYLELALQTEDTAAAGSLKAHLDNLSLPAHEPPLEAEAKGSGGLSGKSMALIGAAAGGAGIAVAVASSGSDEAGGTPPIANVTTTTTTTTTVPATSTPWNCEFLAVPAERRWYNMQRSAAEGNRVRLRSWGTVTVDANGTLATPDGSGQGTANGSAVLPGAPLHSLICAWDRQGSTKFFVGSEVTVEVTLTGILHCTVNEQPDRDTSYVDNSGSWTLEYCFQLPWSGGN